MADLAATYDELLAAIAELEALTARPCFDMAELSRVRYRLSRLSGERRRLVEAICAPAATRDDPRLRALRELLAQARAASTAHIGTWTLAAIGRDWPGYCRASAAMRAAMRDQIDRERAALALAPTTP